MLETTHRRIAIFLDRSTSLVLKLGLLALELGLLALELELGLLPLELG